MATAYILLSSCDTMLTIARHKTYSKTYLLVGFEAATAAIRIMCFQVRLFFRKKGTSIKIYCYSHTLQFEEWNRVELELES